MKCIIILLAIFTTTYPLNTRAQYRAHVSSDSSYFIYEDESARYIYPAEYREAIQTLASYSGLFKTLYEKEFHWQLDQKPTYIIYSSKNQIGNGYATTIPYLHSAFYTESSETVNDMASRSWLFQLLSHETAHLYQTNVKRGYSQTLTKTFGVSDLTFMSVLPPFTYTQHPNIFLPTLFLEGNATYNEGRFGNGGRLYSGSSRSLLLQMVAENKIYDARMLNDHLFFPFGHEKYLIGGFLFLDLAGQHGPERANRYFYSHADYKFNPFNFDDPFYENYSTNYSTAIQNLNNHWSNLSLKQKKLSTPALFTSLMSAGISADENEIRVLTTDLKSLPVARIYSKKIGSWSMSKINLPMGKLFRLPDNSLATPSSQFISPKEIASALFKSEYEIVPDSQNKYVYDIKGARWLWSDSKNALIEVQLFDGPNKISSTQSSAIIGNDEEVYYFKQQGKNRVLYKGSVALFSYKGYYGYPVEANAQEIFFIGPSEKGTSLYIFKDNKFYLALESDRIVDAAIMDSQYAFVAELTTDGYEYKKAAITPHALTPYEYSYSFEEKPEFSIFTQEHKPTAAIDISTKEKKYESGSELKLRGIDPMIFIGQDTYAVASARVRYSDPIDDHSLSILLSSGSFGEFGGGIQYINQKNIINWDIFGMYEKVAAVDEYPDKNGDDRYNVVDRFDAWTGAFGLSFAFYKNPLSQAEWLSHFIYQDEQPHIAISDLDQSFSILNQLRYKYDISPPLGYLPYRYFRTEISHEYFRSAPDWQMPRNIFGAEFFIAQDLFKETYLIAQFQEAYTDGSLPVVDFKRAPDDAPYPSAHQILRHTLFDNTGYVELRKTTIQIKQAVNLSAYFSVFPISVRRGALFAEYNDYSGAENKDDKATYLFSEIGGGIEVEFLLFHKFPLPAQWAKYKNSSTREHEENFTLGINQSF